MTLPQTSSSSLISKSALGAAVGALASAVVLAMASGCGKPAAVSQGGTSRPEPQESSAPLTQGYVRLASLESRHPLQVDVQRLRNAERRLAGLAPGIRTGPGLVDPYELPAVGTQIDGRTASQVAAALQGRRLRERSLLAKRTAAQLGAFLGGISYRQERLLDQRRAELQAVGQAEQERLARSIRESAAEGVRNQVAQQSADKLNRQLPVGVLGKQLRPDPEFVADVAVPGPVLDEQKLRDEVARLTADPNATYVPERARFIVKLRAARKRLQDLQDELDRIVASSDKSVSERIKAAQDARLAEIEMELEALRDDADTLALFRGQRSVLASALDAEADVAARTALFQGLSGQGQDGAGALRFASLFGTSPAAAGSATRALDLRRALLRIIAQRQQLQKFIGVDVRDAVQDAAETHRVDIVFAPAAGRRDMTTEFAQWLRGDGADSKSKGMGTTAGRGVSGG